MQSGRPWASLCVSAVMVAAILTGVYSVMVEPTVTNVATATRLTESPIQYEYTLLYTSRSFILSVVTVTSPSTFCKVSCMSGYIFYPQIPLQYVESGIVGTFDDLCILWAGEYVRDFYHVSETSYICSTVSTRAEVSYSTLTLTSTSLTGSTVESYYFVTETHYENVPNPQKSYLQSLAVWLFLAGVGGIAVAIILRRPPVSAPVA